MSNPSKNIHTLDIARKFGMVTYVPPCKELLIYVLALPLQPQPEHITEEGKRSARAILTERDSDLDWVGHMGCVCRTRLGDSAARGVLVESLACTT